MWELDYEESWAVKNWCFWTVVLKTLESPFDCKEIKPVSPKEINPEYWLGGLMLKLKLQDFSHLMRRADSLKKTLMLGKTGGRRRRGQQRMKWLDGITDPMDRSLSRLWEMVIREGSLVCCSPWSCKESDVTEQLNWNFYLLSNHGEGIVSTQWQKWEYFQLVMTSASGLDNTLGSFQQHISREQFTFHVSSTI